MRARWKKEDVDRICSFDEEEKVVMEQLDLPALFAFAKCIGSHYLLCDNCTLKKDPYDISREDRRQKICYSNQVIVRRILAKLAIIHLHET